MKKILMLGLMAVPMAAFAAAENGGRGGGDVQFIRAEEIQAYIKDPLGLKSDLTTFFNRVGGIQIPKQQIKSWIEQMQKQGVAADILLSDYNTENRCEDENKKERSASTTQGVKAAPVCFNLPRLAEQGVLKSELIGLAAHEHARHFGIDDVDLEGNHPLGAYFTQNAMIIQSNLSATDGEITMPFPGGKYPDIKINATLMRFTPDVADYYYFQIKALNPECANGVQANFGEVFTGKFLLKDESHGGKVKVNFTGVYAVSIWNQNWNKLDCQMLKLRLFDSSKVLIKEWDLKVDPKRDGFFGNVFFNVTPIYLED